MVHIHNGILLSYLKECIWISSNEEDETGAYYTEWSKPERKTPIQYTNTYIWNARQQKRHRCIEQSFGLCGKGRGWDDLGEWHWNMYSIIYETNCQFRFNAWYWMLGAGALRRPREMVRGGRREEGLGWGTRVHLWRIHVDVWQNQYNIVKQLTSN